MPSDDEPRPYPFGPQPGLTLHPAYREARAADGLVLVDPPFGGTTYLATRYDDVRQVLSDPRLSRAAVVGPDEPRVHPFITEPSALSALDPPEHTRLRRVLMGTFTARRVAEMRPAVQRVVDEALGQMLRGGPPADLVADFAAVVPAVVMAEVLGVPVDMRSWFMARAEIVLSAGAGRTPEQTRAAFGEIVGFLAERLAERREHPTGDLLSTLAQAHEEGDRLSDEEMVNLATTVIIAGHETTVYQLANVAFLMLSDEALTQALRAAPERVADALEELLRVAPVMATGGFARVATEDLEIGGVKLKAGEAVMPVHYSANHDERVFAQPDQVDLNRDNAHLHMAFSYGPHHCPGSHLARLELQVAINSLLARLPGLRLVVAPDQVVWREHALTRGPVALPVEWNQSS